MIEAMPTGRCSLKLPIRRARSRITSRESRNEIASLATAALKSPRECPPMTRGLMARPTSPSFSRIARRKATEVVRTAGCVARVSASSSADPSKQTRARSMRVISLASSKARRASRERL